jgi:hypothetical protein
MVMPATSMTMPPTTMTVGSTPANAFTPSRPAAYTPAAISVIIAAPANWPKNGGTRARLSTASSRSSRQPEIRVMSRTFQETVNSSTDPTPTPAFPSIDTHPG